MAEDKERAPFDPAATAFALGAVNDPAMREDVRDYLRRQSELAALQIEDLKREDGVRHWSIRVRHISDLLRLGFELAAALIVTAIVLFIGGAVWGAAHDNSLVIEALHVPADMAANGLTGEVIATQVQDRLAWMQASTDTIRQASSYRNSFADDIKVEIPDTGISIGEFYRYLANWLGHQTHITGEVWRSANGIAVSVRSGGEAARTFTTSSSDLSPLVVKAAERIYWRTQPYRYAVFLEENGRTAEAAKYVRDLAFHGAAEERPWAYSRLGLSALVAGDFERALHLQLMGVRLNPNLPHIWQNLASTEAYFGHDEAQLRDERRARDLLSNPATARQLAAYAADDDLLEAHVLIAEFAGDYREAVAQASVLQTKPVYSNSGLSARLMVSADLALAHDLSASSRSDWPGSQAVSLGTMAYSNYLMDYPPLPAYERAAARDDWAAARESLLALMRLPSIKAPSIAGMLPVWLLPKLALAEAKLGEVKAADALIAKTPGGCYLCARMRGKIAAAESNWSLAATWFGEAARLAPSLPFADADWGAMLMAKGDYDGAIAKFESAHAKGPHFADPLEMWGEALMRKNRSDLALAKFEEADKYAPNWGRLHLKWGEALFWSGQRGEAAKQFAVAATLDLSPSEKSELARASHG